MNEARLQISYHEGRLLAAYYYLPRRDSDRSVCCEQVGDGLVVDYAADGRAIGIEITAPTQVRFATFNELLVKLGHEPVDRATFGPLEAA